MHYKKWFKNQSKSNTSVALKPHSPPPIAYLARKYNICKKPRTSTSTISQHGISKLKVNLQSGSRKVVIVIYLHKNSNSMECNFWAYCTNPGASPCPSLLLALLCKSVKLDIHAFKPSAWCLEIFFSHIKSIDLQSALVKIIQAVMRQHSSFWSFLEIPVFPSAIMCSINFPFSTKAQTVATETSYLSAIWFFVWSLPAFWISVVHLRCRSVVMRSSISNTEKNAAPSRFC